ncbi:hypothetical protein KR222_008699, partial [Zaprionus bogoriensis]
PTGPNTYAFGYEIEDAATGNVQFRDERRYLNGSVEGSYGYLRPDARIQVTRYQADAQGGYTAHTQSYAPGDARIPQPAWPTALPELLRGQGQRAPQAPSNVSWDAKSHLNVSVHQVEDAVAEQLKAAHGFDLFHIDVAHDLLQPELLDIINGKTALREQPNGSLAFETPDNGLPLVPFQLPAEQLLTTTVETTEAETTTALTELSSSKYNSAKSAPQVAETLPPPRPLVNSEGNSTGDWYQRIIEANRREFLEHLPNLHTAANR